MANLLAALEEMRDDGTRYLEDPNGEIWAIDELISIQLQPPYPGEDEDEEQVDDDDWCISWGAICLLTCDGYIKERWFTAVDEADERLLGATGTDCPF